MTLHADLLKQAGFLARREPKRPSRASRRRGVSSAYYALFHLLVDEATRLMFSGHGRAPLRPVAARAFRHSTMKALARQFATPGVPGRSSVLLIADRGNGGSFDSIAKGGLASNG